MRRSLAIIVALLFLFVLAACSSMKAPAEQAIKAAEDALNAVKTEAMKYVPDQVKAVEDSLKSAKDNFAKKEYKTAIADANGVVAKTKDLVAAAAAKKEEILKEWTSLSGGLPKMIEAIKSRVGILSKSKKLPANLDKEKVEGAQSGLDGITKVWEDANTASKEGNLADALAKAKMVKEKAVEIMTSLGMKVPEAAQGS